MSIAGQVGSITMLVMSSTLPQVTPSSMLSSFRMFLLSRAKRRMILPVVLSSTGAGLPKNVIRAKLHWNLVADLGIFITVNQKIIQYIISIPIV